MRLKRAMGTRLSDTTPCYQNRVRVALRDSIALALLVLLIFSPLRVSAEFILTASQGIYQSDDGRTKVMLSHRDNAQGIFVANYSEGIPPQEFNPEKLPANGATHLFVKFDATAEHQYSEVVIGERSYKVAGNLNVWLTPNGSVSVNIDNTNPYLTVTQRSKDGRGDALVGFYGLTEVVKGTGNLATILTANQLSPEIAKIVRPYQAGLNGLLLNGKDVTTPAVGIYVSREHPCTKQGNNVSVLTLKQLKTIQATKVEAQQGQLLARFLKENQQTFPIKGHLTLRSEPQGPMILLNIASKDIFDLRLIKNSFSTRKICVLSPIQ